MTTLDYVGANGFEVRGFNDLQKKLEDLGTEVSQTKTNRIWRDLAQNALLPTMRSTLARVPTDSGQLRRNLVIASQKANARDFKGEKILPGTTFIGRITSGAKREGDKLKTVATERRRKSGSLIFKTTRSSRPVPFWVEYGTQYVRPRNYLRNAFETTKLEIVERAEHEILRALKQIAAWGDPK